MRVWRESGEVGGDLAPFRMFGPTCDSMDSMPGPYDLPADIREGDVLEIGMLGAYGTAMATRFNGFGDVETAAVRDFPWASLYDGKPRTQPVHAGSVLAFPRAKRRKLRMRRR
jgi:ornithine decarboxylase